MTKKILLVSAAIIAAIGVMAIAGVDWDQTLKVEESLPIHTVSITMSSSRPGCESTDTCYVPPQITLPSGGVVTWINDDSAFHTVTSGYYGKSDGLFDSGQLEPAQRFSYTFEDTGTFHYFCKLHPWMEGKAIVR